MPEFRTDIEVPNGYKFTGEFRKVRQGESYLYGPAMASTWGATRVSTGRHFILQRDIDPVGEAAKLMETVSAKLRSGEYTLTGWERLNDGFTVHLGGF